jgi:UrcA family protein
MLKAGATAAVTLLAALATGSGVHAQPSAAGENAAGEDKAIVVEAPRRLPPPSERSAYSGAPVVTTTVQIWALYGDLDLAKPADQARLTTRIERVARDACVYLDRLYPLSPDPECVGRAVAQAMPAADATIAAAKAGMP